MAVTTPASRHLRPRSNTDDCAGALCVCAGDAPGADAVTVTVAFAVTVVVVVLTVSFPEFAAHPARAITVIAGHIARIFAAVPSTRPARTSSSR